MKPSAHAPLALGIAVFVAGIACGGGGDSSGPPTSGRKTVLVVNNAFQPATVTISAGDTVLWSWGTSPQSIDHNILSYGAAAFTGDGSLAQTFDAPHSYQVIFPAAGTYTYYCSTHGTTAPSGMAGSVVVNP